jgi:hypothetical protein
MSSVNMSCLLPLPGAQGRQAAHHYAQLSPSLRAHARICTHLDSIPLLILPPISVCFSV